MREIKFRAWDGERMRESFLIHQCNGNIPLIDVGGVSHNLVPQKDWLVMQYTGLKDKHGKEIYEGDILQHEKMKPFMGVMGYHVEQNKAGWTQFAPLDRFQIIGNIYENPELLEP